MDKIVVRNSCIVINDYELGDCVALERNFQVYDPIRHKYDTFGMYYSEDERRLYIPRGLDIWKIKQYFDEDHISKTTPNPYLEIDNILLKTTPRDEQQKEALRFMVGVNEYIDNQNETQISVNLNTGKGKTYCAIATICILKIKSIIIAASVTLLKQWIGNIKEYTNLIDRDIMLIEGSTDLNMISLDRSSRCKSAKLFLCTHATLRSYAETYGWESINDVFIKMGIGVKIFDEAHTNYDNMLMIDFFTNVAKTYYVTATPARSDYKENKIYQLSMKNVPGIDLFDAVNDPHTEYIAIKWNSKPTAQQISACANPQYGLDRNKYVDYVTNQPNFYKMMRVVMDLVLKCNGRALMYIATNKSLLRVYKWIGDNYPEYIGDIGIYTSLIDKDHKMEEKDKKLLLSTTKSAGLGEHIEGLKMTIVLAEPFKSEVVSRQTLGRTRDKGTVYIELVDMAFKQIKKFYHYKLPIFNKYASGTSDMTIDQYELDNRSYDIQKEREKLIGTRAIDMVDGRFFEYKEERDEPIEALIFYD